MRRAWLIALALLAPSAFLAWQSADLPYLGQYHDDGLYWTAAHSLAAGHGYRIESLPTAPSETKYPPLYPLALAAVWRLNGNFPANLSIAALLAWVFVPVFVLLAGALAAEMGCDRGTVLVVRIAAALSPATLLLGTRLLSELPFACCAFGSMILAGRALRRKSAWYAGVAGLAAGAAYLTRSAGLPLVAALPLCFALKRQMRNAVWSAACVLPAVAAWTVWSRLHRDPSPALLYYTDYLGFYAQSARWTDIPALFAYNTIEFLKAAGALIVFDRHGSGFERVVTGLCGIAAVYGAAKLVRERGLAPWSVFAAGYSALLLAWYNPPTERFLVPLFPVIAAGFLTALRPPSTEARPIRALAPWGLAVVAALALFADATMFAREVPAHLAAERQSNAARQRGYEWIRGHVPPSATFLAYYDTALYLHTGRRAIRPTMPVMATYRRDRSDVEHAIASLGENAREQKLEYVFWTANDFCLGELLPAEHAALRRLLTAGGDFEPLYSDGGVFIYRIRNAATR